MKRNSLFLFISLFILFTLLSFKLLGPGRVAGGDEAEYLAVAHSLAEDHEIYLEDEGRVFEPHYPPNWESEKYLIKNRASGKEFFPESYVVNVIPAKGHLLPYHPIGLSLLVLPGQILLGNWGARLIIALCAALLAVNLFLLSSSFVLTFVLIFSPPLIYFSLLVFNEIPTALLTLYSYRKLREKPTKVDNTLVTAAIAFLPWLHPKYILISALLVIFACQQRKIKISETKKIEQLRGSRLLAALNRLPTALLTLLNSIRFILITLILSLVSLLFFYLHFYGTSKAALATANPGLINPLVGGCGLLFDRSYGLIPNCPVYLLAILGLTRYKNSLGKDWFQAALIGLIFLQNSFFGNWHGGATPPGRFLVPILPFLGFYILEAIKRQHYPGKALMLLTFSFGVILASLNLFKLKNLGFALPNGTNNAYHLLPLGDKIQLLLPSLVK